MTKIRNIIVMVEVFFLCSCSAGITRYGYAPSSIDTERRLPCHVSINNKLKYAKSDFELVGQIRAYDTSFSIYCDEAYILDIFSKEACALGSNIINITEEKYPDLSSTCYRAKADFLRLKNKDKVTGSDPKYTQSLILERSLVTSRKNKEAMMNMLFAGMLGGTLGSFGVLVPH